MSIFINVICLVCISLLIGEIMVYFCKDAIKLLNETKIKKSKNVVISTKKAYTTSYETKIAK